MIKKAIIMYIFWIISHYISSHLYVKLCTPMTIQGFLLSPLYACTPHCKALQWIAQTGSNSIHAMWVIIGSICVDNLRS